MIPIIVSFSLETLRAPIRFVLAVFLLSAAGCATPPKTEPMLSFEMNGSPGTRLAFDDRAEILAASAVNGRIHLWHLPDGRSLTTWRAHDDSVHGLVFLHNGNLVSAGYDATLALWSQDGKLLNRVQTESPATAMIVDRASNTLWTGHADGYVQEWRLDTFTARGRSKRHRGTVRALTYDPDTKQLASSGTDGDVLVSARDGEARALEAPPTDSRDLTFSEHGRALLGGGWFKLFRWDVPSGKLTVLSTDHYGIIAALDLRNDGKTLASVSRETDSAVRFIDAATGNTVRYFNTHSLCGAHVRLSPGERYLASLSDDAGVWVFALDKPNAKGR